MLAETSEASAKAGPGVLLGGEPRSYTEFEAQSLAFADRYGLDPARAKLIVRLLRGGAE